MRRPLDLALTTTEAQAPWSLFARQVVGDVHPRQHLISVEVRAWFYVFRMVEQCCVKVHFVGKPL
jgi:hypothetical protein